ncbi:MAG: hypothetical protein SX243_16020 [Acidobacteriota bacterium]|nr:hypothetical protein [Acidobacteriota bacterium]
MQLKSFLLVVSVLAVLLLTIPASAQLQVQTQQQTTPPPAASSAAPEEESDLFTIPMVGFEMTKPESWVFLHKAEPSPDKPETRLNDELLNTAAEELSGRPLAVVAKYPQPHSSLNPTLQVAMRSRQPLGDLDAPEILTIISNQMRGGFPDFQLEQAVTATEVSGLEAATFTATYTVQGGPAAYPVRYRMWVIPRGSIFFILGMSGAQEGEDAATEAFQQILESVKIQP